MCVSNPDVLPEVQSATSYSTLAFVFSCVTFLACMYWPFGTVSMLAGIFGGSGSTLIAAEQTERKALLMELDPLYCDVIVKRWEEFTGRTAERVIADVPAEIGSGV